MSRHATPNIHKLLANLRNVKPCGENQWTAYCPVHEAGDGEHHNSLSVAAGDDGHILVNCHNNCDPKQVIYAAGLTWKDCFPPKRDEPKSRITAVYDYEELVDGQRILRYQVCRLEPDKSGKPGTKDFRQRQPNGKGGHTWNTRGITKIPYRLPELLQSNRDNPVFVVEGEKQVDYLRSLGLTATCNSGGAGKWLKSFAKYFADRDVIVIPDADLPNEKTGLVVGAGHAKTVADSLLGVARSIHVVELPDCQPKWGLDDWLEKGGHTLVDLKKILETAEPWGPESQIVTKVTDESTDDDEDDRVPVELTTKEFEVNNEVIAALRADHDLYQRGGQLVTVLYGPKNDDDKIKRQPEAPRIEPLSAPTVREKISQHVRFYTEVETDDGIEEKDKFVPKWCVDAVHARGQWDGIRPLTGVINHPILRPDGSILTAPGYDRQTGIIHDWRDDPLIVPDRPSWADAVAAVGRLKNLVSDFPFETPAHLAGWLAFLLTMLVRYAFQHAITSPLFLIDANVRGSGKSMLADLVGLIVCGFELARMVLPRDDEEMRKSLLSIAMAGDEIILLDNVAGELGGQSLDAVLTGKRINGRVLGFTKQLSVPINSVWAATSNNASIVGDLCRRTIHIRLASPHERPEERTHFAIPDLIGHVRQHRRKLLTDLCVILRAYIVAGRPTRELTPMGSFEEWSSIVRQCLVWLDESDPWDTRLEFAKQADSGAHVLGELFRAWSDIDEAGKGLTANEIVSKLESSPHDYSAFRAAVRDLCACKPGTLPSARTLGKRLAGIRDRVYQGQRLVSRDNGKGIMIWKVEAAADALPGFRVTSGFISAPPARKGESFSENRDGNKENAHRDRAPETRKDPETRIAPDSMDDPADEFSYLDDAFCDEPTAQRGEGAA